MHFSKIESYSRQFRLTVASLAVGLLSGCEPSPVQAVPAQVDGEVAVPSRPPTSKEMHEASAPDYKSPPGMKQECFFGRLVFDVAQPVEWPTFYKGYTASLFNRSFSRNVWDPADEMRVGNTLMAVIGSIGGSLKERVLDSTPAALEAHLKTRIKAKRAYIAELRTKGMNTNAALRDIREEEETIRGWEETIKEDEKNFEPFNPGLPNSQGYWTSRIEANDEAERYSVLRAYLTRGDFI
jgi:hypothetical protein